MTYDTGSEILRVVYLDGSAFDELHRDHQTPQALAAGLSRHDRGAQTDEHAHDHGLTLFRHELPTCGHSSEHRIDEVDYLVLFDPELGFAALYRKPGQHPDKHL